MTKFRIKAAGRVAAITALYESSKTYCRKYLTEEKPDFSVEITRQDIALEREKDRKSSLAEGRADLASDALLERTAIQRKLAEHLFAYDTIIFHGSCVAVDGVGYLFTAKSGTGKSTHTRLWRQILGQRAVMINDDKPFLQITQEGVVAYGSPWNGKHKLDSNVCVPLKAICILERGEENVIRKIAPEEALYMLLQQSNRPGRAGMLPKYMELLDRLACGTAFYRLQCNMEIDAARVAYGGMSKE